MIKATDIIRAAPRYLGVPYSTMDCQAFVEKAMADAGLKRNLAGSNAWWRFALQNGWTGTPEECRAKYGQIPKGAFLFILLQDGREPANYQGDGIGNASHIGIYTGQSQDQMLEQAFMAQGICSTEERKALVIKAGHGSGAINSSASWGCVATSKFAGKSISGGWNRVWLWTDMIDYATDEETKVMKATVVLPAGKTGGTVNMRTSASTSAPIEARVPVGAQIEVYVDAGQWCQIEYNGQHGYMMSNYIEYDGQADESGTAGALSEQDRKTIDEQLKAIEKACDTIGAVLGRG